MRNRCAGERLLDEKSKELALRMGWARFGEKLRESGDNRKYQESLDNIALLYKFKLNSVTLLRNLQINSAEAKQKQSTLQFYVTRLLLKFFVSWQGYHRR